MDALDRLERMLGALDLALEHQLESLVWIGAHYGDRSNVRLLLPESGIWRKFLEGLVAQFGSTTFTSEDFSESERHYLSRLSGDYRSLIVMGRHEKRNIYQVNPEVLQRLRGSGDGME